MCDTERKGAHFLYSHLEDEDIFLSGNEKGPYACGISPLGGGCH